MISDNSYQCDECENFQKSVVICLTCIETLCQTCDSKIHNKGTRVRHKRVNTKYNLWEDKNSKFHISYFSRSCYKNQFLDQYQPEDEIRKAVYDFIFESTKQGNLLVSLKEIKNYVRENLEKEGKFIEKILLDKNKKQLFQQTIRTFGDYKPLVYYSLKIREVSLESIIWIIKSIFQDKMKPTDSLVNSRFKECFGICMRKEWKYFIDNLTNNPKLLKRINRYSKIFGSISIQKNENHLIFKLENLNWEFEDYKEIDEKNLDYQSYLVFIKLFFSKQKSKVKINKWISSLKNSNNKSQNDNLYKKILQNKEIERAIPGGKYGCALMIKNCGPENLQKLSIGNLISFVSKSLKDEILVHIKTFLVWNSQEKQETTKEVNLLIKTTQKRIISILKDQPKNCVTLAQLPALLIKKYKKQLDLSELGFPKLKNFLLTMSKDVELEEYNKNHIKVKLIKKKIIKKQKKLSFINHKNKRDGYETLKPNQFDQKVKQMDNYCIQHKKSFSTMHSYLKNIKFFIISILKKNAFGIQMEILEEKLNVYLGTQFNPKIFSSDDFEDFLLTNFDDCLELQVQRQLKTHKKNKNKKSTLMVYPKVYSKQKTQNKIASQFFKPSSESQYGLLNCYQQKIDPNQSGFFSDHSVKFGNKNFPQTTDSFSESSLIKYLPPFQEKQYKTINPFSPKKQENFGFEFQVISPIPSLSTTQFINQEQEREVSQEEEEDGQYDFDVSRKFIENLINEDIN